MYMLAYGGDPRNPRQPADFADFADIFRKSLKLLGFSRIHGEDILRISTRMRIYPRISSCARDRRTLSKMEAVRKSMTAMAGFITVRTSREKKSLTACFKRASSRVSLPTGSALFLPRDAATPAAPFSQKR